MAVSFIAPATRSLRRHHLARGARLVPQVGCGERILYIVASGLARYVQATENGKESAAGIIGSGEVFAYQSPAFPGSPEAYIEALDDVTLLVLEERRLGALAAEDPEMAAVVMRALIRRCEDLKVQVADLALADVRARVIRLLLRLSDRYAVDEGPYRRILPALKHQDVAALVGACRETVTSTLAELAREGIVRTGRCSLAVHVGRALVAIGG